MSVVGPAPKKPVVKSLPPPPQKKEVQAPTAVSTSAAQASTTSSNPTIKTLRGASTFEPARASSSTSASATRIAKTKADPLYQKAVTNQRQLSVARQELGREQLAKDRLDTLSRAENAGTAAPQPQSDARIKQLSAEVTKLEAAERSLPTATVEKARFTVFKERMASLEGEVGPQRAAALARQTYYNDKDFTAAAAGDPITTAATEVPLPVATPNAPATWGELNYAGLPHGGTTPKEGDLDGTMRTLDGEKVDMGHVACALDWKVNKRGTNGNPFDANAVTMSGDVASAIKNVAPPSSLEPGAAIKQEGDADWNGDIDGNNIAHRLDQRPGQSLSQVLDNYYDSGQYKTRIDEWATHSKYVKRSEDGTPLKGPRVRAAPRVSCPASLGCKAAEVQPVSW